MANHGMRAPRGSGSAYLNLPNTSVSDRAREHLDLLTHTDEGPFIPKIDHATAARDLQDIDAPAYLVKYHQDMADQGPANQNSASLADRADQTKHILEEE